MPETKMWYILRTKFATESKLAHYLSRKGYETYCPHYTEAQLANRDGNEAQVNVLFPGWVFVQCTREDLDALVAGMRSVKAVFRLDQVAAVTEKEISLIKHALFHYHNLQLVKTGWQPGPQQNLAAEEGLSYALPSLGFVLMAREEVDYVYHPLWTTNGILPAETGSGVQKSNRSLLKRLPYLVGNKVSKLSLVFSRATWS